MKIAWALKDYFSHVLVNGYFNTLPNTKDLIFVALTNV